MEIKEAVRDIEWARNHYNEMANREDLSDDLMAIILLLHHSARHTVFENSMQQYYKENENKKKKTFWDFMAKIFGQMCGGIAVNINETVKQFNHWYDMGYSKSETPSSEALGMAIETLERTRWIPVSERLPDGDVASVMIYTESGGVAEGQYYPTIKAWKQFRWSVENANVTHWMPLPNPPEVE